VDQAYLPDASAASWLNFSVAQKRIQVNKELIIRKANENKFNYNTNREGGLVLSRALKKTLGHSSHKNVQPQCYGPFQGHIPMFSPFMSPHITIHGSIYQLHPRTTMLNFVSTNPLHLKQNHFLSVPSATHYFLPVLSMTTPTALTPPL
jgi:hypothetical protein